VRRVRRKIKKTKKYSNRGQRDFEPDGVKVGRFKFHESSNRCNCITVGTDPTLGAETGIKVVVRDLIVIRGSILGQLGFREKKQDGGRGKQVVLHRVEVRSQAANVAEIKAKRAKFPHPRSSVRMVLDPRSRMTIRVTLRPQ